MVETLFCWECFCRQDFRQVSADVFKCVVCGFQRELSDEDSYEV